VIPLTSKWLKRSEQDKKRIYHEQLVKGAVPTAKIDNPFSPVTYVPNHLRAEAQKRFLEVHFPIESPVQKKIDKMNSPSTPRPHLGIMTFDDWNKEANICKQKAWKILHALEEEDASKVPLQVREVCKKIADLWFRRGIICSAFGAFSFMNTGNDKFDKMMGEGLGGAFKALHINDLQMHNCNRPTECPDCIILIDFLKANFPLEEAIKFVANRAWPIGWRQMPEFQGMKMIVDEEERTASTK
jgi:hypothetical protein